MEYTFTYSGVTHSFYKDEQDKDRYLVFTCAKNEDDYIKEWIEHYLSLGFDKIIIADNNDDNTKLPKLLENYISENRVQIFDCHGLKKFQLYIYNMFLEERNFKWCAFFDCDEFLELSIHSSIKDFLQPINEECVLINWLMFGSNDEIHRREGSVQDRFKIPVSPVSFFKENFYVKPIIKGEHKSAKLIDTHCPIGVPSYNIGGYYEVGYNSHVYFPPRYKYAYIKHYYTKSFSEWVGNKIKRGWPDEMYDVLKEKNYFILQNKGEFPIEKFTNGLFVDNNYYESIDKKYEEPLKTYNVIELRATGKNVYSLMLTAFSFMKKCDNHIFMLNCDCVDDNLYNLFLEYSFNTTNKVFAVNNENEIKKIVEKYSQNNGIYYYIDCL